MTERTTSQTEAQRHIANSMARTQAWIDQMNAYATGSYYREHGLSDDQLAREQYIAGHITIEAFEAKLDLAFGLTR